MPPVVNSLYDLEIGDCVVDIADHALASLDRGNEIGELVRE